MKTTQNAVRRKQGDLATRFWSRIQKTATCWLWDKPTKTGYGHLRLRGKNVYAHRLSYTLVHGPIPAGMEIDHLCWNKRCVNPKHLRAVCRACDLRRHAEWYQRQKKTL